MKHEETVEKCTCGHKLNNLYVYDEIIPREIISFIKQEN